VTASCGLRSWSLRHDGRQPGWWTVNPVRGIRGSVARYLGILATGDERWDDAEIHFEAAISANERRGLRPWLAYARHDYARMLVARDGGGDRERAERLLGQALAGYRELGMTPPAGEPAPHR
jgi:hypothetical protein